MKNGDWLVSRISAQCSHFTYCLQRTLGRYSFLISTTTLYRIPRLNRLNSAHIVRDCLNVNFPGRWIGGAGPIAWPPSTSWSYAFGIFFLWSYAKDQVYSQRVNTLDELKARIIAAIVDITKGMLQQCVWQGMDYRWDVRRGSGGVHCEMFHT
jgi:hypothetical protein